MCKQNLQLISIFFLIKQYIYTSKFLNTINLSRETLKYHQRMNYSSKKIVENLQICQGNLCDTSNIFITNYMHNFF